MPSKPYNALASHRALYGFSGNLYRQLYEIPCIIYNIRPNMFIYLCSRLLDRNIHGQYEALLKELRANDKTEFKKFTRLPTEMFDEILVRIKHRIQKKDTWMREALSPGLKLAIVLRHIATGDSLQTLMYGFRVSDSAIAKFLPVVLKAIIDEYAEEAIDTPSTPEEWLELEKLMRTKHQVPHSFGGLDGKHCRLAVCPSNSGSLYYNYKGFYSFVLLALVDGLLRFRWIDVGANGACSDTQILNNSELFENIENNTIGFPEPSPLPGDNENMPYFILGDEIFGLKPWLMKPIPGKLTNKEEQIYNYRISRGRRVAENGFGVLANRFRILLKGLHHNVETAQLVVTTCVVLHNLMRLRYPTDQARVADTFGPNGREVPGRWRREVNWSEKQKLTNEKGNRDLKMAKLQRLTLQKYFNSSIGAVPWQDKMV